MPIHTTRDYVSQSTTSSAKPFVPAYLLAVFLRRVLGYSYVGDTNYNINSVSTLLIATGDTTPTAVTPTFGAGRKASIANNGSTIEVAIPVAVRGVVISDINRMLILKSALYPTRNSGIFAITGLQLGNNTTIAVASNGISLPQATINVVSTTGFPTSGTIFVTTATGTQSVTYTGVTSTTFTGCSGGTGAMTTGGIVANQNKYVIDYRGNGELCLPEAADTVSWYLYETDFSSPISGSNNAGPGYRGFGTSTTPRVILQSPHATGYQIRICAETSSDSGMVAPSTCTPGFGGNSAGDFAVGGQHLHMPLYFNVSDSTYSCGNGISIFGSEVSRLRYTIIGDDTGQSLSFFVRSNVNPTQSQIFSFGIPDNEASPLPINSIGRLYVIGNGNIANQLSLSVQTSTGGYGGLGVQGSSFKDTPISCNPSLLTYVSNTGTQGTSMIFNVAAGDCPFTSATELVSVDLITGITPTWSTVSTISNRYAYYPRFMGTIPFVKSGRANFGEFVLTTDSGTWSVTGASNATPISITTSTTNNLVTGQTVAINGVLGNTNANGTWVVTVINGTTFTLNTSVGNGAYTSGGTALRGASYQHMRNGVYMPWNGPSVPA